MPEVTGNIQLHTGQAEQVVFIDLLVQRQAGVTTSVLVKTCRLNPEGGEGKNEISNTLAMQKKHRRSERHRKT